MTTNISAVGSESRRGYWRRVFRPLVWWFLLVLALFGIHQHQLALERTRIYFSVSMYGTNVLYDATATLDGRAIGNADNIALGSHRLIITQGKAESFSTNFFAWYGRHDLGKLDLRRAMGTLSISAEATANEITISGSELAQTLNNSTGTNLLVPTDTYHVNAQYRRWSDARDSVVTAGSTTRCTFAPKLSVISITCDKSPASYELQDATGNAVEQGDLPTTVTELPAGHYFVLTRYRNHVLKQVINASNTGTNEAPFHFAFGAAGFESVPSGASVYTASGDYLGTTPVVVTELPPSTANYRLQLNDYVETNVSVTVVENQTNAASAALISLAYIHSMQTARRAMGSGDYRNALASLEQSLIAKPSDLDALNLQTIAKGREAVQEAKGLAGQGDYVGADQKLQSALEFLPNDAEARLLQTQYEPHEVGQRMLTKAKATRDIFDRLCQSNTASSLFEAHEVTITNMTPEAFRDALVQKCEVVVPTFKVALNHVPESGICELLLDQSVDILVVATRRECVIVVGTDKDGQTLVLFKVLNYTRRGGLVIDLNALNVRNPNEWVPLNASRNQMTTAFEAQIRDGERMMRRKIAKELDAWHQCRPARSRCSCPRCTTRPLLHDNACFPLCYGCAAFVYSTHQNPFAFHHYTMERLRRR